MKFGMLGLAMLLSGVVGCPAIAEELAPSTSWTLDYADDSCALRRVFVQGNDQIFLEFRRFSPGLTLQTTIGSNRMTARNPARIRYRFGDDGEWRSADGFSLDLNDDWKSGVLFTQMLVSDDEAEAIDEALVTESEWRSIEQPVAARTTTFDVKGAFSKDLDLRLGSLGAPIAALNDCVDELMTHWGIDVEAHKTLTRNAEPVDMRAASRMVGYPPLMAARSMPGLVNVRLAIDETGKVTDCHIQMPLSDPQFEQSSCDDIRHAFEFIPALDKTGKPIASYWVTRVVFHMN
jgi:hypothetical protein